LEKPVLLLVDDEPDILSTLALRFTARGYEVLIAGDGPEALELFKERRPNVVVMDIRLPTLDGVEVLREMLEFDPKANIIMMSGHVSREQAKMVLAEGARDFIPKPVDPALLETSVSALLMTSSS
jgi:DNA-binding response OmpR family regulator